MLVVDPSETSSGVKSDDFGRWLAKEMVGEGDGGNGWELMQRSRRRGSYRASDLSVRGMVETLGASALGSRATRLGGEVQMRG